MGRLLKTTHPVWAVAAVWTLGCLFLVSATASRLAASVRVGVVTRPPFLEFKRDTIAPLMLGHLNIYEDFLVLWTANMLANEELGPLLAKGSDPEKRASI